MAQNKWNRGNGRGFISVMITRFSAIGDVAMTVPVIYSACRCYPDIRFVMVTRQSMTGIFVNAPSNLVVEGVELNDYSGIGGMRRLVSEMCERHHIDAFVDLHNVIRTRLMGLFCRLRRLPVAHLNKGRDAKRALTRRNHKVMLPLVSQRSRYREVFYNIGLPVTPCFAGLFDGRCKSDPALFAAITPPRREGERWIGIAPFAAHRGKVYPPELMHATVQMLSRLPDVKIFLMGGAADREALEAWASESDSIVCMAGKKYGFSIELALLNHMNVVVTMDSANMHLAAIAGTPTVSLWGATHPYCGFKGWQQSESDMIQLPMTCRPCSVFGDKPCHRGDYLCLSAIKPELVFKKVIEHL